MPKIGKAKVTQSASTEREILINGVQFFVGLREGRRLLSACHESRKILVSAAAHLEANGYSTKVKKCKEPGLYMLEGREKEAKGKDKWEYVEPVPTDPAPEKSEFKILPADPPEFT